MLSSVIPSVDAKWEVKEVPTPQAWHQSSDL